MCLHRFTQSHFFVLQKVSCGWQDGKKAETLFTFQPNNLSLIPRTHTLERIEFCKFPSHLATVLMYMMRYDQIADR